MNKRIASFYIGGLALTFLHLAISDAVFATPLSKGGPSPKKFSQSIFGSIDSNGLSPFWKWKTLESDHFRVTFPEELEKTANRATQFFEEAHRFLSPLFQWDPPHKTQILVINNTDSQNGLTSPIARYGIVLWVTPPDYGFGSHYYDDWLRLLVIHEYTHFLNMDTTDDFYEPLRYLIGDSFLPNSLWPPWMLEGLAVYMETRFTKGGRGRSPYYEMILRAAVEDSVLNTPEFITLDKINGTNPYFPSGDTRYIFGYNLMNQVSQNPSTLNPRLRLTHHDEVLGSMSKKSGHRIPYFINDNLRDITGKDWYQFWDEWVDATRKRVEIEIQKIKSQPTNSYQPLLEKSRASSNEINGVGASPDGRWLAYTLLSSDRREGLYLMNLETGESKRLLDKLGGIGVRFTPDSKTLIYSRLHQIGQYYQYSDLEAYDLESGSQYWLSQGDRLRDPDISKDGKWVTFTISEGVSTGLAIAPLVFENQKYRLGTLQRLFIPPDYSRVGNPQFSPDGKRIYFAYHQNEKSQEDLLEWNRETQSLKTLVSDGKYNRFPAIEDTGEIYFVSDRTGTDNLYHFNQTTHRPELVTNMITGINFPSFGPRSKGKSPLYAGVFSTSGWSLSQVDLLPSPVSPDLVTLSPPPAPEIGPHSTSDHSNETYFAKDYSLFPSLWPRIWSPILGLDENGALLGGAVFGFDAINVHRYFFSGTYNTDFQTSDWDLNYSNRTLGPAIDFSTEYSTDLIQITPTRSSYSRTLKASTSIEYPLLWTYSSLVPHLGLNIERSYRYLTGSNHADRTLLSTSSTVPSVDAILSFTNAETSRLAVTTEGGNFSQIGTRTYFLNDEQVWKSVAIEQHSFRLFPHTILTPSAKALWVSHVNSAFLKSNASLEGRTLTALFNPFPSNGFDRLSIRGYPNFLSTASKFTGVAALDLTFPLARIFHGLGTNPFFVDNFYGNAFIETSYFPHLNSGYWLPSAGGGVQFSLELFTLPLTLSAQYHLGFRRDLGGEHDLFFQVLSQAISF